LIFNGIDTTTLEDLSDLHGLKPHNLTVTHPLINTLINLFAKIEEDVDLQVPQVLPELLTELIVPHQSPFQLGLPMVPGPFNGPTLEDGTMLEIITLVLITLFLEDLLESNHLLILPEETSLIQTSKSVFFTALTHFTFALPNLALMELSPLEINLELL